jgi:tRNA dimethylallyltransferase
LFILKMPWVNLPPLVVVVGPTAVGKTEISIQLAERLGGEIVSADSRLFYRGMDIGTAKPTGAERQRIPHHLIDVSNPDESWSLARFQSESRLAITGIHSRDRLPFLVGGTGQYIRAVIEEWSIPPKEPDHRLRDVIGGWGKEIGPEALHTRLGRLDPAAAENIDYRNVRRTIRALEVIFSTGRLFSTQRTKLPSPYDTLVIGLKRPRPELYSRVDVRIDGMLTAGFIEEVRGLLASGYSPDLPSLSAIGYQEIVATLQGKISLDEAIILIKRNTRQFVRRQANWFKESNPAIHWEGVGEETVDRLEATIRQRFHLGK